MEELEVVRQSIGPIVAPLLGLNAWDVRLGVGSFITAEFGNVVPPKRARQRAHGEWHLWIMHAAWRIEQGDTTLAASEDPRPKLKAAVENLNGRSLLSLDILAPSLDTLFGFDGGLWVRLFSLYSEEYEHWQLFVPGGNVLVVGPNATWSFHDASLP